jgi:HD-GYP domain-containing protein (c-di-GMP phosphodiesterase class II)
MSRTLGIEPKQVFSACDCDAVHLDNALVLTLVNLVKQSDGETGGHVWRLHRYSRCLAEEAARFRTFAGQIDAGFIWRIECGSPLHDIGKVGIPDHILLKPGRLTFAERNQMISHTLIGSEILTEVAEHYDTAAAFLQTAIDIVRHHHERFDGEGYPDRLAGADIPLAARIVAIGDVYDALRSRRVYKPALSHTAAIQIMTEGSPGHFDPMLMHAFHRCAGQFDKIFHELIG